MESPAICRLSRLSFTRGRSVCSQPSASGRPASSKKPSAPAWARPSRGIATGSGGASSARAAKAPREIPVASSTRVRLSVEGQRGRGGSPGPKRLDGLKLVASRPARRASPEGDVPSRCARASRAFQSLAWDRGMAPAVYLEWIGIST